MLELLRNAWKGWLDATDAGKLGALLLLVFLLVWLWKLGSEKQKDLFRYGAVMTAVCICPVSAVLLMLYQTKFYDYEWIWTAVPTLAVLACGGTLILERLWEKADGKWMRIAVTGMALAVLLLCGKLGNPKWTVQDVSAQREEVSGVLKQVGEVTGGIGCLWAPKEVMAQARSLDGSIRLLYGRNMWQEHLNAFSYDDYAQDQRDLYAWMSLAGAYGTLNVPVPADLDVVGEAPEAGGTLEGIACIQKALDLGVDQILLPGVLTEDSLAEVERTFSVAPKKIGQYWLLSFERKD